MSCKLIFIFSLPRAGSTLLQRMLSYHPMIHSVSEPWLLLPFVYSIKRNGIISEYNSHHCSMAINDLIEKLPNGTNDYFSALRNFIKELYFKLCSETNMYFLDKTPRYYLIISEIAEIFPDAKFIFLFRNPLAVLSSIIQTFYKGKLDDVWNRVDLYEGPFCLANGYEILKDKSIAINYEKLLRKPEYIIKCICQYLEIEYLPGMIDKFYSNTRVLGKLGDKTGIKIYNNVCEDPINKWKSVLNTPIRKKFAIRYLSYLGKHILSTYGYDLDELLNETRKINPPKVSSLLDYVSLVESGVKSLLEIPLLKKKIKDCIKSGKKFYIHY